MKCLASVVAAAMVAAVAGGCSSPSGGAEGTLHVSGSAVRVSGVPVTGAVRLRRGDAVSVGAGTATIDLPGGGRLELRRGSAVQFAGGPTLEAGDLLVVSAHDPVQVNSPYGQLTVAGAARLRRDLAVEVGTYQGSVTVAALRTLTVPRLDQDTLPAVGLVPDPAPIRLDASDPWDQRFLGNAIELTTQLDGQSRFVSANAPAGTAGTAMFYREALGTPAVTDALLSTVVPAGGSPLPPGEALVGAAVALSGPGPFGQRWDSVFSLRRLGGQWGVVVLAVDAEPARVLHLVAGALDGGALVAPTAPQLAASEPGGHPGTGPASPFATGSTGATILAAPAPASSGPPPVGVPGTGGTSPPAPSATVAPTIPNPPTTVGTIPATPPTTPPTTPPPAQSPPLLAPIVDPLANLVRSLLGGG